RGRRFRGSERRARGVRRAGRGGRRSRLVAPGRARSRTMRTPPDGRDRAVPAPQDGRDLPVPAPRGPRILLGVTGGIAAYKSAETLRALVQRGAAVRVALTPRARRVAN